MQHVMRPLSVYFYIQEPSLHQLARQEPRAESSLSMQEMSSFPKTRTLPATPGSYPVCVDTRTLPFPPGVYQASYQVF